MKHLQLFEDYINEGDDKPLRISDYVDLSKGLTDADLMGETILLNTVLAKLKDVASFTKFVPSLMGSDISSEIYDAVLKRFTARGTGVEGVTKALTGWVAEEDLLYVMGVLQSLIGLTTKDGKSALKRFIDLYRQKTGGRGLIQDVNAVGTRTFEVPRYGEDLKDQIIELVQKEGN